MKNIFILGVSRTGKSTLTKKIKQEFPYYKTIPLDFIINAYKKTFDDKKLGYSKDHLPENKLSLFIKNIMDEFSKYNDISFIIEGDSILPDDYHQYFDSEQNICFFLINTKTPEQKLQDCRQYDNKNDWSTRRTNQELLKHFEEDEKIQEKIIKQAKKYNYEIIDISKNREQKLEMIYQQIKSKLKNLQNL